MKKLLLFDVDGTLCESGKKLHLKHGEFLNKIKENDNVEIGIVGGGKLDKILWQTEGVQFDHYFSECGCVYNKYNNLENKLNLIYEKNIREHKLYSDINILIKTSLKFLSEVDYTLSGNFIDLRTGIIYISLIGLTANENERNYFKELDSKLEYRKKLLNLLQTKALELKIHSKIHIVYGGSVGIAIYPSEYDKKQIIDHINQKEYYEIHYFGDMYLPDGNDYLLLNHEDIHGHKINKIDETYYFLNLIK
jgi:phosphomannomutase